METIAQMELDAGGWRETNCSLLTPRCSLWAAAASTQEGLKSDCTFQQLTDLEMLGASPSVTYQDVKQCRLPR